MTLTDRALEHLARIPREPHLHVKRTLAIQARELIDAEENDPAAVAVMLDRHALELPDRPTLLLPHEGDPPARDPFVELGTGPSHPLNEALIDAEVAAATAAELPDRAPELARLAAERMDATVALEAGWGAEPVDVARYARLMALPAADRLEQLLGEGRRGDEDPAV